MTLVRLIAAGDAKRVSMPLVQTPSRAKAFFRVGATRACSVPFYFTSIEHYVYEGDTSLHVAAAAYDETAVRDLLAAGNKSGSAPRDLASQATGRGGSGTADARG